MQITVGSSECFEFIFLLFDSTMEVKCCMPSLQALLQVSSTSVLVWYPLCLPKIADSVARKRRA